MDDMAVVGCPTALFSFSFSGKGTDNGLGASSGSMSQPLLNLDLLCIHLALIFVLSKIILVIASPSCVHGISRCGHRWSFIILLMIFIISSYLISPPLSCQMWMSFILFTSTPHKIQITSRWIVQRILYTIFLSPFSCSHCILC